MPGRLTSWLREPLVHFLLLGALIYGLAPARGSGDADADARREVITAPAPLVRELEQRLRDELGATPNEEQLRAALEPFALEEALYREALRERLDQGDAIIRRRLVQKMGFVLDELTPVDEPDDAALRTWLVEHQDRYGQRARVSFEHVYFSRARDGDDAAAVLPAWERAGASQGHEPPAGDPFPHGRRFAARTREDVARLFGDDFADAVLDPRRPLQTWFGPIESAFGEHLVRLSGREPARPAALAEARAAVRRDVLAHRRAQARARAEHELRARYRVVIDRGTE